MARAFLASLALIAGLYDLRRRRIPNWLVAGGLVAGFSTNAALAGSTGLRHASLGFIAALAVYLPLYLVRAVGGGDVKLMAAIGSIAGPANWLVIFVLSSLIGGVLALAMIVSRGRLGTTLFNIGVILTSLARLRAPYRGRPDLDVTRPESARLPHGVTIAVAVVLFLGANR